MEDIVSVYTEAWRLGLKAIAIYRDGSKHAQPLNTSNTRPKQESELRNQKSEPAAGPGAGRPPRRKLPDERRAITHKFSVGGHEGYLTVGL